MDRTINPGTSNSIEAIVYLSDGETYYEVVDNTFDVIRTIKNGFTTKDGLLFYPYHSVVKVRFRHIKNRSAHKELLQELIPN